MVAKNKIKHDCKILNSTTKFSNIIYILSFHLVQFELIFFNAIEYRYNIAMGSICEAILVQHLTSNVNK